MMVIHGDIPMVNRQELRELLRFHREELGVSSRVAIAPDREGLGTNVMVCTPPDVIDFH